MFQIPPTGSFIAGTWCANGSTIAVRDPATGEAVATVTDADLGHADAAVSAAHAALPSWSATSPRDRSEILRRAFELMRAEEDQLAALVTLENGKILADARSEIRYAAEFFRWFAEEAVRISGEWRVGPDGDKRLIVSHEPVGVSLCITPWNFPAAMVTRKLAPALAAGTTVVVKPATETPLTSLAIAELMQRAGLPDGVVNVVVPSQVGEVVAAIMSDDRVRQLSFTGSTAVGKHLIRQSADQVIRCSMELGGNAPFIVLDDADIGRAVEGAMVAKMRNGGAACTAANRFYVGRRVADEFTSKLATRMGSLKLGRGSDPDTGLGPLVSDRERDGVASIVDTALSSGATALVGGEAVDLGGAFYPATVLTGIDTTDALLSTEIFGPVAPIAIVDSAEEAVACANSTPQGLAAYLYTGDLQQGLRLAGQLEAGMVGLNRGLVSDPAAPFGGVKQSGIGREGGFEGIQEFLETKYIATDL
ncbi:NAD-dependent succinate-semialdehyde dehydrogenase [Nitriliruptor alkaliphilus]|uniref:NAD-dependent succinate-semialdehyde dehydrogenase n=1 Tax=Nitriliruptor alkaliphilus TaxID=427918 RepID=UPI0006962F2D|nr:NAD-dependent succinate-semialdehyde dehydrogenase [Nitriliruptor alkaliphilus]